MGDRPLIGVTAGETRIPIIEGELDAYYVGRAYVRMLNLVDADAVLLPAPQMDLESGVSAYLNRIDGLLLAGGVDIQPSTYGQQWEPTQPPEPRRDALEVSLVREGIARGIPILGVCRGMQMINVALGGSLLREIEHSDVPATDEGGLLGVRRHDIELAPGSHVRRALEGPTVEALCLHHQAPDRIGEGLRVTGRAADGIVEAIELESGPFCLGVQWHPEHMVGAEDLQSRLYGALSSAARERIRTGLVS